MNSSILNISPVDSRYKDKVSELNIFASEFGLIKYRVFVEIKWLIYIVPILNKDIVFDIDKVLDIYNNFNIDDANKVKDHEKVTNHDVKAVEYFIKDKLLLLGYNRLVPYIHITLTSEDVNNISYNLMIKDILNNVYFKNVYDLVNRIDDLAILYKSIPMASHTHGQLASPTTVGKEFKVFSYRIKQILKYLENIKLTSKLSGAVGNYNASLVAYPNVDWIEVNSSFVNSLGLDYNYVTTQIESHDIVCMLLSNIKIINNIIKDMDSDMWIYICLGYFKEKSNKNEVGSSVMPHKVNPINYENSMANIEISNSIIDALVNNLSISRMQRDLSDSSKLRNIGVIFAHSIISIKESIKGLNKNNVDINRINEDLDNPSLLTECYQTVLRKNGIDNAYELLKDISRGEVLTFDKLHDFIKNIDIDSSDKEILLNLKVSDYIGLCEKIVDNN